MKILAENWKNVTTDENDIQLVKERFNKNMTLKASLQSAKNFKVKINNKKKWISIIKNCIH